MLNVNGLCGPRCHNSKKPKFECRCWCGGTFHGIGHAEAVIKFFQHLTGQELLDLSIVGDFLVTPKDAAEERNYVGEE